MSDVSYVVEHIRDGWKIKDEPTVYDKVLLELCRSDTGSGIWSLRAPGSPEPVHAGEAKWITLTDRWDRPNFIDIHEALKRLNEAKY